MYVHMYMYILLVCKFLDIIMINSIIYTYVCHYDKRYK